MWALICDEEDGELRVVSEDVARGKYLNGSHYSGKWKLEATNADEVVLLHMAMLTGWEQRVLDDAVCFGANNVRS